MGIQFKLLGLECDQKSKTDLVPQVSLYSFTTRFSSKSMGAYLDRLCTSHSREHIVCSHDTDSPQKLDQRLLSHYLPWLINNLWSEMVFVVILSKSLVLIEQFWLHGFASWTYDRELSPLLQSPRLSLFSITTFSVSPLCFQGHLG